MDKDSNSKFQFRLPNDLSKDFKVACQKLGIKPSEKLRDLMSSFVQMYENEMLNREPYVFPKIIQNSKGNVFTIGEMYCGPGGIALAAKKSKLVVKGKKYCFEHVWATDNHQDTCMTFQTNIPNKRNKDFKVICDDISENLVNKLPYVDGFLYGFPCNDFSNVGETKGLDGKKDQLLVKHFLNYLFNEIDPAKKIGFPLDLVDLQLKSATHPTTRPKKTLANFTISKSQFPKIIPKDSLIIKHRPSVHLKSSLNLYFGKGRKTKSGKYEPRGWYEIEISSQKKEQLHPWYPKGTWTAFVKDNSKYYKLEMVTSSGDPKYPKAIQSKNGRHILGELIKGKLERKNVLKKFEPITQEILDDYGKDFIELKKIKHGVYVMVI